MTKRPELELGGPRGSGIAEVTAPADFAVVDFFPKLILRVFRFRGIFR